VNGLKNLELVKEIMANYDNHDRRYDFRWVRGHDGNKYNELADKIVNRTMDALCCEM